MKFSVIIPVYNVERYLDACVGSVLGQTFGDYELILVDDGSTDGSPAICDRYAAADRRVKVIHQPNAGQAAARNAGLETASGDYVCFIDSDDYLADGNVLAKLAEATASAPDIVHYKFKEWHESAGRMAECRFSYAVATAGRTPAEIYGALIDADAYYNSAWSKIIRRRLLTDNGIRFEAGIVGEDNEWYYHVVSVARSLVLIDEALYVYRRRAGSTTAIAGRKNLVDQLYVIDKWTARLKAMGDDPRAAVIRGSLAKQYCSAVIIYAGIGDAADLYPRLRQHVGLLDYTRTRRVAVFRSIRRLLGLKGLIMLLRIVKKLR